MHTLRKNRSTYSSDTGRLSNLAALDQGHDVRSRGPLRANLHRMPRDTFASGIAEKRIKYKLPF